VLIYQVACTGLSPSAVVARNHRCALHVLTMMLGPILHIIVLACTDSYVFIVGSQNFTAL